MSYYAALHLAAMYGFFYLGVIMVGYLIAAGICALYECITRAPEGHEDRAGFHQEDPS